MGQYKTYTDEELLETYTTSMDYSGKAEEALNAEIAGRGGMEALMQRIEQANEIPNEVRRIRKKLRELMPGSASMDELKASISSNILSKQEIDAIIDEQLQEWYKDHKDQTINSRTITGSIAGIVLSSAIGCALLVISAFYLREINYKAFTLIAVICYGIIWLFTGQSRNNIVVLIATVIATGIAIVSGLWFYKVIAYDHHIQLL